MSKRPAEDLPSELDQLKGGERPLKIDNNDQMIEYEDEFEDEFESEDEIFEAGVDGRPDEEHGAGQSRGMWITLLTLCGDAILSTDRIHC